MSTKISDIEARITHLYVHASTLLADMLLSSYTGYSQLSP